nr:PhnD/SsuA/transferrin family substrate-binding protein [uncultured Cupriavidus sp.]
MATGIASTRMYNATPAVTQAWQALLDRVFNELGWAVDVVPFAWPASLTSLWQRPDLVCGFMCGLPFAQGVAPVVPLAAPVPSPAVYGGLARYRSELLVRSERGWNKVEDTFGHRIGWMATHSQSGYHAARLMLAPHAASAGALFAESVGPLDTPMRALSALRENAIDVTALDSYFLDLIRRHEPALLDGLQTIAWTPWTPNPLLVASATLGDNALNALSQKLCELHCDDSHTAVLDAVQVSKFVHPDPATYKSLAVAAAQDRGYPALR